MKTLHRSIRILRRNYAGALSTGKTQESLEIRKKLPGQPNIVDSYSNLAKDYTAMGDLPTALSYDTKALDECRTLKSPREIIITLTNIGITYSLMADTEAAKGCFDEALERLKTTPNEAQRARTLLGMGGVHLFLGDYKAYENTSKQAVDIFQSLHQEDEVAGCWLSMGLAEEKMSRYDEALNHLDSARTYYEKQPDQHGYANCLNALARINLLKNQIKNARDDAEKARDIGINYDAKLDCAIAYNTLALCADRQNDFDGAIELEKKAQEIRRKQAMPN